MAAIAQERVLSVRHWNDTLFSFTTTRDESLRFKNGHFVMIGLEVEGRPLLRAYSIASANYDDYLEFFSIKVPDGPLTSRLQHLREGDMIYVSRKPTGTLVLDHLLPGKHLYLLSTGTGLAPFMSIVRDPETYERFDKIILVHGVRYQDELAYQHYTQHELANNEFFGEQVKQKLIHYPTVSRETYIHYGRVTDLMKIGKLFLDSGLPKPNVDDDRFMVCGSPAMLKDTCKILDEHGFAESRHGKQGHYVVERAFVEQ